MTEPRGFYATWSAIFGMTALPFGVLMTVVIGLVDEMNMGLLALTMGSGLLFGVLMGLVLAPSMRGVRTAVPVQDKAKFAVKLRLVMAELNYKPGPQASDHFVFDPPANGILKIGPVSLGPPGVFSVFVQLDGSHAEIVGPKRIVDQMVSKLRPA
ncbi:MAG: hypothetical protein CL608_24870 [Anaerolineaceae bacterium]|nr:hypothetical protein [Anaerolineaceae bacterium]